MRHYLILVINACVFFLATTLPTTAWSQQSLSITSPAQNATVSAGSTISISVNAVGTNAWVQVFVAGNDLGLSEIRTAPPFVFTIVVPQNAIGIQTLNAIGIDTSGNQIVSDPVTVNVVPNVELKALIGAPLVFSFVGEQAVVNVSAKFVDGTTFPLARLVGTSFATQDPNVAAVDVSGRVTAIGVGKTNIIATYNTFSAVSSVAVPNSIRGDLNADGIVDSSDVGILQESLNTRATAPNDSRDLNHDGKIDILDARILTTLCTYPRCASQ